MAKNDVINAIVLLMLCVIAAAGIIATTSKNMTIKVLGVITLALALITLVAIGTTAVNALGYEQPPAENVIRPIWGSLLFGVIGLISLVSGFYLMKSDKASTAMFITTGIAWLIALIFVGIDMWKLGSLATTIGIGLAGLFGTNGFMRRKSKPDQGKSMFPEGSKSNSRGWFSSLPLFTKMIMIGLLILLIGICLAGMSSSPVLAAPIEPNQNFLISYGYQQPESNPLLPAASFAAILGLVLIGLSIMFRLKPRWFRTWGYISEPSVARQSRLPFWLGIVSLLMATILTILANI